MAQVWYYLSYNVEILRQRTFQILTLSWIFGDYISYISNFVLHSNEKNIDMLGMLVHLKMIVVLHDI